MVRAAISQPPGISGGSAKRAAPTKTMIAITISETALTSAARISARWNPKLRFGVAAGGRGLPLRRRPPARPVGEVVPRVGEQREAACEERGDHLDERVRRIEDERDQQRPQRAAHGVGVKAAGTVIVIVCVPRAHRQTVARLHADARAAVSRSTGLGRLWENAPDGLHPARCRRRTPCLG